MYIRVRAADRFPLQAVHGPRVEVAAGARVDGALLAQRARPEEECEYGDEDEKAEDLEAPG